MNIFFSRKNIKYLIRTVNFTSRKKDDIALSFFISKKEAESIQFNFSW